MNNEAIEARRKYYREYYKKNKERLREYNRKYRDNNPDKVEKWNEARWNKITKQNQK